MKLMFRLNGRPLQRDIVGDEMLQGVLRDEGLTGSRLTCGVGVCGACTVHLDGQSVASCILPAALVNDRHVETIESVSGDDKVVQSFCSQRAIQCGYCTPGAIMEARAFLAETSNPSPEDVRERMAGNLCRCGCYMKIEDAVIAAAEVSKGEK